MNAKLEAEAQRLAEKAWAMFTAAQTFNTQDFTSYVQSAILEGMKLAMKEGRDAEVQGTHWENCWESHLGCAVYEIRRLMKQVVVAESARDGNNALINRLRVERDEAASKLSTTLEQLKERYAKVCDDMAIGMRSDPEWMRCAKTIAAQIHALSASPETDPVDKLESALSTPSGSQEPVAYPTPSGAQQEVTPICQACRGSGEGDLVYHDDQEVGQGPCGTCGGTGIFYGHPAPSTAAQGERLDWAMDHPSWFHDIVDTKGTREARLAAIDAAIRTEEQQ